ncbi:MAG: LysR family transcriptional regulator [Pseudomonadota bacterium]
MKLSIKALRYFQEAMESRSITTASRRLNIAPSAVAAAIDQVEDEFALKLAHRHRAKGIVPTSDGLTLLPKVKRLLEDYDALLNEGGELKNTLSGVIKIGYYAPVAPAFLPGLLTPMTDANPELLFRLEECDSLSAQSGLLEGRYDIILFVAENVRQGIAYEALVEAPAYFLTRPDHRFAARGSVSLSEISDEPMVVLDLPVVGDYYRTLLEESGSGPTITATATSTEMVRSLVGAGLGSAILNMRPLTGATYAGEAVVCVPIIPAVQSLRLLLGYTAGRRRRGVDAVLNDTRRAFASDLRDSFVVGPPA